MGSGHRFQQRCASAAAARPPASCLSSLPHTFTPSSHAAGIGKAIAKRLAGQGLNVVLVALGDQLLDDTHQELTETFPNVTFRKVPAAHTGMAEECVAHVAGFVG